MLWGKSGMSGGLRMNVSPGGGSLSYLSQRFCAKRTCAKTRTLEDRASVSSAAVLDWSEAC